MITLIYNILQARINIHAKLIKNHIDKPLSFHLDNLKNNNDIFKDVFNFVKDFSKKYKLNFNFNLLLQSEENSLKDLRRICDSILEEIYDISFLSEENSDGNKNNEEFKEKNEEEIEGEINEEIEDEENNAEDNENNNDKNEEDKTFYLYEEHQRKRKIPSLNILEKIYGINKK